MRRVWLIALQSVLLPSRRVRSSVTEWTGIIIMKNNIGYLLASGFKSTFKHGFMSFAAVCITVACLVIINSFLLICYNLNNMVEDLQKKNRIIAVIDETMLTHDAKSVGSEINMLDNVENAVFVSREQALAEFGSYLDDGENAVASEREYFSVSITDAELISDTFDAIRAINGVLSVTEHIGEEEQVSLFVVAEKAEPIVQENNIAQQIIALENVAEAKPVSGEEALQRFGDMFEDGESLYAGVDASAMRDQYEITLKDNSLIAETKAQLEEIFGIVKVEANVEQANAMVTVRNVLYVASIAIASVLLLVSLVIISNTIKLAMMDRKEEIAIMKMVGATNSFIRLPFLVEGFILGLFGSLFSFFIEWGLYEVLRKAISGTGITVFGLTPFVEIWIPMVAICAIAGFVIGIFGSLMSIRRFLKV
ncbi:MAG: FtsX-like permease family protein [Ruminococcaceae bacterium]|nr:FtsX-like permease family protein [Oscillospiraceae bacterium]